MKTVAMICTAALLIAALVLVTPGIARANAGAGDTPLARADARDTPVAGAAAPAATITLKGQLSFSFSGKLADVWGYVDPATQREYALVCAEAPLEGVKIVDVTDPTSPVQISEARGLSGFDVKVWQNYMYVTHSGAGAGGRVFDLTDPTSPVWVAAIESSHNMFIDDRGYLYQVYVGSPPRFRIKDLNSSPLAPPILWQENLLDPHDAWVEGTTLYAFYGYQGTRIYDVTDPSAPVYIGKAFDNTFHHSGMPTADGRYLYVCHELNVGNEDDITVWNIEDPANPVQIPGASIVDTTSTVHNLYIIGDYAYVSYYASGFRVYDVSDPEHPTLADEWDTSALTGDGYKGAFGVYPFTPSGTIYITDMENGLYLFGFSGLVTAVTFASFDAGWQPDGVHLEWSIGAANDLGTFNIYRSSIADAGFVKVARIDGAAFNWIDPDVERGTTYYYRIGAVDRDGEFFSQTQRIDVPQAAFALYPNHPNPFNPSTTIPFELSDPGHVILAIYDARGRHIRTLIDEARGAGRGKAVWDGLDARGSKAASGVYFARLSAGTRTHSLRMVLLK